MKNRIIKITILGCVICGFILFPLTSRGQEPKREERLNPRRLTNVQDCYPVLSPNGAQILFQSDRTGNWEIYGMNPDDKKMVQLTNNPGADVTPRWSPDGSKIVFASERDNDSEIYVMDASGSNQRRLTNQPGDDSHPNWSSDGRRIIFNSARTTPDLKADWSQQFHEIFSMNADGDDVRQLSRLKTVSTYPSYSPDGKRIVFRSVTKDSAFRWDLTMSERNSEVFIMSSDGSEPANLTKNAAYDGWPTWSPDGRKILFSSNRTGPANLGQLFVMNPDGSDLRKITDGPGSFVQASWSRDGKRIFAHQHWETEEFGNLVDFVAPIF